MSGIVNKIKNKLVSDESVCPAIRVDDDLYNKFTEGLAAAKEWKR